MAKAFPWGYAVEVAEADWLSQPDAAEALNVSLWTIAILIANDRLEAAETTAQQWGAPRRPMPGVTRSSVEREWEWRRSASFWRRLTRWLRYVFNSF